MLFKVRPWCRALALRILLNTICRKPGFNSLRTPLNHGAEQASNETLKQTQQRNWSNASQGGQTALKNTLQYCITKPQAQRNSRGANTEAQLRIARLQAPLRGNDKVIIHSPQVVGLILFLWVFSRDEGINIFQIQIQAKIHVSKFKANLKINSCPNPNSNYCYQVKAMCNPNQRFKDKSTVWKLIQVNLCSTFRSQHHGNWRCRYFKINC